jgi:hypothetical protein
MTLAAFPAAAPRPARGARAAPRRHGRPRRAQTRALAEPADPHRRSVCRGLVARRLHAHRRREDLAAPRPAGARRQPRRRGRQHRHRRGRAFAGDGYTFVISTNGPLVYNTVLYKKLGYDPFTELRPVVLGGAQANVCAVRSDSGINSLGELVKAMKASPGKFNFSSTGVGSLSQLGVELLKAKTDTFAVHIPYASSPLAIMALLQGDVQFAACRRWR